MLSIILKASASDSTSISLTQALGEVNGFL